MLFFITKALLKMEQMASTDALTGLFNRRCLTHEFCEAFGVAEGDGMWLPPGERVRIW